MPTDTVIWKFQLPSPGGAFTIKCPFIDKVAYAGLDGGLDGAGQMPCVWLEVDQAMESKDYKFMLVATGEGYDGNFWRHVATMDIKGFFFHLLRPIKTTDQS